MKRIIDLLIIAVFFSEFQDIVAISGAFKAITISPEFLSLLVFLCGLTYFGVVKKIVIDPKYLWLFMFVGLYFLSNIVLNSVPAGAIIGGLRRYVKFLPLFFFPLVYEFSDEEILQKLKLILWLSIIQFPISFAQRFILYSSLQTGDVVRGTMSSSGILSVYLNCVIAVALAFYLYKKIPFRYLIPLSIILFFPMLINETKSTLLLLPVTIFIPILLSKGDTGFFKKTILMAVLFSGMMGTFVITYNHFWGAANTESAQDKRIEHFLQNRASGYLFKGVKPGEEEEVGRLDALYWAYTELSDDPMKLVFGLGMGNVGKSLLSFTEGKYSEGYQDYAVETTTLTFLLWEVGIFGILILLLFFIFIIRDSLKLRRSANKVVSALATGWIAVGLVMIFALGYKNLLTQNVLGFLFFLLSGYLVSKKIDFEEAEEEEEENFEYSNSGLSYY